MVISSARPEDSGRYECVAESTSGHRASLAAQLLVARDTRIPETSEYSNPLKKNLFRKQKNEKSQRKVHDEPTICQMYKSQRSSIFTSSFQRNNSNNNSKRAKAHSNPSLQGMTHETRAHAQLSSRVIEGPNLALSRDKRSFARQRSEYEHPNS